MNPLGLTCCIKGSSLIKGYRALWEAEAVLLRELRRTLDKQRGG